MKQVNVLKPAAMGQGPTTVSFPSPWEAVPKQYGGIYRIRIYATRSRDIVFVLSAVHRHQLPLDVNTVLCLTTAFRAPPHLTLPLASYYTRDLDDNDLVDGSLAADTFDGLTSLEFLWVPSM